MEFRWNDWNLENATKHGVTPEEAEHVVRFAKPPFPKRHRQDSWLVIGRGASDRVVEVIYLVSPADTAYIIHAMPLGRQRSHRRRKRKGKP